MSDIPKADQYDTSAIDTHIKEIAKRERSITTGLRLKNLSQIVLWTSLAGFAFALIFILISYGIRLMIYPPPEKEFIERPIPSEVTLKLDETPIPSEITLKLVISIWSEAYPPPPWKLNKRGTDCDPL